MTLIKNSRVSWCLVLFGLYWPLPEVDAEAAQFDEPALTRACGAQLSAKFRQWRIADGITLSPKGARYYDFETDTEGTYKFDGVQAYCLGKAGATYEFENGSFRRIVDGD
jgi:hypothetical protein